jgi:hypothetical protein
MRWIVRYQQHRHLIHPRRQRRGIEAQAEMLVAVGRDGARYQLL